MKKKIEEIYDDKINKLIQIEDFKMIYERKQKERWKILKEIEKTKKELEERNYKIPNIKIKEIKKLTESFFKMEYNNKIIFEKLIERIEFDKEKNVKVKLTFQNQ